MLKTVRHISLLCIIALLLVSCDRQNNNPTPTPDSNDSSTETSTSSGDSGSSGAASADASSMTLEVNAGGESEFNSSGPRMGIRLSAGRPIADIIAPNPFVTGQPLSDEEAAAVLNRLDDLEADQADVTDFNIPPASQPRPITGDTVTTEFPAPESFTAPDVVGGDLEVLRFAPEGAIGIAPFLSVTFNQPMVELATIEQLAAQDVPVTLTPALEGEWKWLGAKTLTFEAAPGVIDRFPKSTEYRVEIPAGTTSATGGELKETVAWSFTTPTPQIENFYPQYEPQTTEPLMFVEFDQRIDPALTLSVISLDVRGQSPELRLASEDEISADARVSRLVNNSLPGRSMVFRTVDPLPSATQISVKIGPFVPSLEGPLLSDSSADYQFETFPPLKIDNSRCGWGNCAPFTPFEIFFNNPLDAQAFDLSQIQIEPALPNAIVGVNWNSITIRGATQGQTDYTVTVSGDVRDAFGQTLGDTETLRFKVGSAESILFGPGREFVTLDPSSDKPLFSVYSVNHDEVDVIVHRVTPDDMDAYRNYLQNAYQDNPPSLPGTEVLNTSVETSGEADQLTETLVDLSAALDGPYGQLIVQVTPATGFFSRNRSTPVTAWVQITEMALDAYADNEELIVWATALADGTPLSDVAITAGTLELTTDAKGLATGDLSNIGVTTITASRGEDVALLNSGSIWDDYGWRAERSHRELRWFVFDDRQMYRPGEEVHIKGWARAINFAKMGDVALPNLDNAQLNYIVYGPQYNEITSGRLEINALGGFDFNFTLPDNVNLGYAEIQLSLVGTDADYGEDTWHQFQIQEFRRPEFEVSARNESTGPYFGGENATVAVSAEYFAGGPLPNATVFWNVTSSEASYTPPNHPDFTFGQWTPWWYRFDYYYEESYGANTTYESFEAETDANGEHYLQIDFDKQFGTKPFSIRAEAVVEDVNRQAWASQTTLLVHPSELYVGLRSDRTFVRKGTPYDIDVIVVDVDGNVVGDAPVTVTAERLEWRFSNGTWGEETVDTQTCNVVSAAEALTCTFATDEGGRYSITAIVTDADGRANQSNFTRWVSGGKSRPNRNVEQEDVSLIPDKESYAPGDTAEILVLSPFGSAEGLLLITRGGILEQRPFTIDGDSFVIEVPISDAHIPNIELQVDLVGSAARVDDDGNALSGVPDRPAYATGTLPLNISLASRALTVEATPQDSGLEPGGSTTLDVKVTDANGNPVSRADVAVVVVDEAILALTNYQMGDPLSAFYSERWSNLRTTYGRQTLVLTNPAALVDQVDQAVAVQAVLKEIEIEGEMVVEEAMEESATMAMAAADTAAMDDEGGDGAASTGEPIRIRTDFNPLATFAADVPTDGNGMAQVAIELPDNLTRYRIMVVAAGDVNKFGRVDNNLTARLPLMVRPSAPRFLNFGDQLELPIVIQNQTDEPLEVDVALETTNLILTDASGYRVTIPANDRVEVRFPATTDNVGTARFQVAAVSGRYADAASGEFPVYTPSTKEAFATYGVLDEGATIQPLAAIDNVYPQFGGLELQTSSTALQALTDAVLYLYDYPFRSSENLASRILAISALRDVLGAFSADGLPSPEALEAMIQSDINDLEQLQNGDGGFPYWQRSRDSIPYLSAHVAHALVRANAEGFDVSDATLDSVMRYVSDIESHYDHYYTPTTHQAISAYALYVRDLNGDTDSNKAAALMRDAGGVEALPFEAVGWLWHVLEGNEEIGSFVANRVVETANAANFISDYGESEWLIMHSDRRTDAIMLDALIQQQPDSDLIPKVVNGLLAGRTRGHWNGMQENTFVLLALNHYFNTFEAQTPDFVAQLWLGDTYAAEHTYEGRTTERTETLVPMQYLMDEQPSDIVINKEGVGRLYYRLGLRYAPTDLDLEALDRGFVVQRTYEAVDDPGDVWQDADGVWHIKAGAQVRVKLDLVADNRRYHVALIDPLPAGLEIVNPALAVSADTPNDPAELARSWWYWTWYDHQNMRDDRAEIFATQLWAGAYDYSYIARATTPGTFVVPPTRAEEMYSPETFGRAASETVIVEP